MGAVFMDKDNHNFSDRLTWLFGHARRTRRNHHVNDVNFYDRQ